jgi:hypothetical protein
MYRLGYLFLGFILSFPFAAFATLQGIDLSVANSAGLSTTPTLFSSLPSCAMGTEGQRFAVTDSTTAVWGGTITGSGVNHVLAYCNGTNWTVAAK